MPIESQNSIPVPTVADLGAIARQKRKSLGLALKDLSKKAGLGVRFLSEFERGKETAELGKVLKALECLGLELTVQSPSLSRNVVAEVKANYQADGPGLISLPESLRHVPETSLTELLEHFNISRLCLFGSAARGEITEDSDLDFLVEFHPNKTPSLSTLVRLRDALGELFDERKIDIATRSILNNPYRRQQIEKDLLTVYAA